MLESLFNKVAVLWPATLLKRDSNTGCVPVKFAKILRTPFLKEHTPPVAAFKLHNNEHTEYQKFLFGTASLSSELF